MGRARHDDSLILPSKGLTVARDVPIAGLTTWRTGGPARFLVECASEEALRELLEVVRGAGIDLIVLGKGSNVLVSDRGFDGVVLRLVGGLAEVEVEGDSVRAQGGASLASVAAEARRASLTGLEFASGIPGTVGGAVMTNAGAYGASTAEVLEQVRTIDSSGRVNRHRDFTDSYREHLVPAREIVLEAVFSLSAAEADEIIARTRDARSRREASQPLKAATAGSVFKNPPGASAGQLLDRCGLKGASIGGARVSDVHANFIVNEGGASARDIRDLMEAMAERVRGEFGIELEPEVRLIGFEEGSADR